MSAILFSAKAIRRIVGKNKISDALAWGLYFYAARGAKIRVNHRKYKWKGNTYLFRSFYFVGYDGNKIRRSAHVEYATKPGKKLIWHRTEEGVAFDDVHPVRERL